VTPRPLSLSRSAYAALLALLAATIAALAVSGTAAATTSCGKAVLKDWFDNERIDRIYDLACYQEAIDAIPFDLRDYSDAEEVISRALEAATAGTPRLGHTKNPHQSNPPPEAAPPLDTSATSSLPIPLLVLGGMSLVLLATGVFGYLSRRRRAQMDEANDDDLN
jgi:hypothetical protein